MTGTMYNVHMTCKMYECHVYVRIMNVHEMYDVWKETKKCQMIKINDDKI